MQFPYTDSDDCDANNHNADSLEPLSLTLCMIYIFITMIQFICILEPQVAECSTDTCFPPTNKLHKILNRNTVKISYKCMPNMKQIISNHNKTILNKDNNTESKTNNCNCRIKEACPVNQKCQTSSLIYQATVTRHDNNKEESYIGLTDNTFKTRYNGHTSSFRNEQYRNATTLSNYIWTLKDKNINYSLKWKIIDRGRAYQPSGKNCGLCDLEKFYIISRPELASLNQRNELATSCRHRKKHLLCNK